MPPGISEKHAGACFTRRSARLEEKLGNEAGQAVNLGPRIAKGDGKRA